MDVQIPTKLRRNAPCPCGSGRKFKKCCGKKEHKKMEEERKMTFEEAIEQANAPKLKNEFRNEIRDPYAGIPEDELVRRDQAVLLKELRFNKHVNAYNRGAVANIIESSKELRMELLTMPKSPYREMVIEDLKKNIENNQNQLKAIEFPRFRIITLLALEELFAETEEDVMGETPPKDGEGDDFLEDEENDELTIPDGQSGDGVDEDDDPRELI